MRGTFQEDPGTWLLCEQLAIHENVFRFFPGHVFRNPHVLSETPET